MTAIDQTLLGQLKVIANKLTDNKVAIGFEQILVSSTAIPLTTIPPDATSAFIVVDDNAIRYTLFGTPTVDVGYVKSALDEIKINTAQNLNQFKMIAKGADTTITVTYFK